MNRASDASIIPKIILILGTLCALGIILLFFRPKSTEQSSKITSSSTPEELFTQVILAARPQLLKLWQEGDSFIPKQGLNCPAEIHPRKDVGGSYYQCQPHFWQCYWEGGAKAEPRMKIDLEGRSYHLRARPAFGAIEQFSSKPRFYQSLQQGFLIELEVEELPGLSQRILLKDTCRDTYLPQRIYGYGKTTSARDEGFIWDNFDRHLFLDKFYVSNQKVNEWRVLSGEPDKIIKDPAKWPLPATLNLNEQKAYCHFFGKRLLEAKLMDAASMTPPDLKNSTPDRVPRPATPWQRDLSKTFLGMARINLDFQLTPLNCQLSQVLGCTPKYFTTDSATWMGIFFSLGFYPESLMNTIEPSKNLKLSSRFLPASSEWHELGLRSNWDGEQSSTKMPVAFRCYEEVAP